MSKHINWDFFQNPDFESVLKSQKSENLDLKQVADVIRSCLVSFHLKFEEEKNLFTIWFTPKKSIAMILQINILDDMLIFSAIPNLKIPIQFSETVQQYVSIININLGMGSFIVIKHENSCVPVLRTGVYLLDQCPTSRQIEAYIGRSVVFEQEIAKMAMKMIEKKWTPEQTVKKTELIY